MGVRSVRKSAGFSPASTSAKTCCCRRSCAAAGLSLDQIFDLFPNLKERLNSQGTKLSGGEQQMLAIARILRTGARFLMLDEPTEGLAPVIIQQIGQTIARLKKEGFTILLVEQNFRFASTVADRYLHRRTRQDHRRFCQFGAAGQHGQAPHLSRRLNNKREIQQIEEETNTMNKRNFAASLLLGTALTDLSRTACFAACAGQGGEDRLAVRSIGPLCRSRRSRLDAGGPDGGRGFRS